MIDISTRMNDIKKTNKNRVTQDEENVQLHLANTSLEEQVTKLNKGKKLWKTDAVNWINTYIRDKYHSQIDEREKEIQRLKIENKHLTDDYESIIAQDR